MFRNSLFTNNFYTAKSGWDSSQFKLLATRKVVCIMVMMWINLKINQIKYTTNY